MLNFAVVVISLTVDIVENNGVVAAADVVVCPVFLVVFPVT